MMYGTVAIVLGSWALLVIVFGADAVNKRLKGRTAGSVVKSQVGTILPIAFVIASLYGGMSFYVRNVWDAQATVSVVDLEFETTAVEVIEALVNGTGSSVGIRAADGSSLSSSMDADGPFVRLTGITRPTCAALLHVLSSQTRRMIVVEDTLNARGAPRVDVSWRRDCPQNGTPTDLSLRRVSRS